MNTAINNVSHMYACVLLSIPYHLNIHSGTPLIHQKETIETTNCSTDSYPTINTVTPNGISQFRSARYIKSFFHLVQDEYATTMDEIKAIKIISGAE